MYLNKVQIIGNLTKTPELKTTNDIHICNLQIAVNKNWTDNKGEKKESVQFLSVVVFGKQAETCAKWLEKGQKVYVEGEINNRTIENPDGSKTYKTGINANIVQFGQKPRQGDEKDNDTAKISSGNKTTQQGQNTALDYSAEDINIDDIPF